MAGKYLVFMMSVFLCLMMSQFLISLNQNHAGLNQDFEVVQNTGYASSKLPLIDGTKILILPKNFYRVQNQKKSAMDKISFMVLPTVKTQELIKKKQLIIVPLTKPNQSG